MGPAVADCLARPRGAVGFCSLRATIGRSRRPRHPRAKRAAGETSWASGRNHRYDMCENIAGVAFTAVPSTFDHSRRPRQGLVAIWASGAQTSAAAQHSPTFRTVLTLFLIPGIVSSLRLFRPPAPLLFMCSRSTQAKLHPILHYMV